MHQTYHAFPSLICTTRGKLVAHHVIALLVHHDLATELSSSWRDDGHTLKWHVLAQGILDVFPWRRPECFLVALLECFHRIVLFLAHVVTAAKCGIVWAFVVIEAAHGVVERIDQISAWDMVTLEVWRSICGLGFFPDGVQRTMAHISWKSLAERRSSLPVCTASGIGSVLSNNRWV